jgi:hypothetical protein
VSEDLNTLRDLSKSIGFKDPVEIEAPPAEIKLPPSLEAIRLPTFQAVLLHKLNIIHRAAGTKRLVARRLGIVRNHLFSWLRGSHWPSKISCEKIDREYAIALAQLGQRKKR